MTINGVEQNCIKSQSIVYLLDVLEEGFMKEFTTPEQYQEAIKNKMAELRGEINGMSNS